MKRLVPCFPRTTPFGASNGSSISGSSSWANSLSNGYSYYHTENKHLLSSNNDALFYWIYNLLLNLSKGLLNW